MNVKKIDGALLNFWVAKSAGLALLARTPGPTERHDPDSGQWHPANFHPASDWSTAGPIVSNEWYVIEDILTEWFGPNWAYIKAIMDFPLQWFMRAYVASQFGDVLEDMSGDETSAAPDLVARARLQLDTMRTLRPGLW